MSEQKRRRVQINIALTGELADAFERFEKELRRGHADAARVILREYLRLTGYFEPEAKLEGPSFEATQD